MRSFERAFDSCTLIPSVNYTRYNIYRPTVSLLVLSLKLLALVFKHILYSFFFSFFLHDEFAINSRFQVPKNQTDDITDNSKVKMNCFSWSPNTRNITPNL